LEGLHRLSSYPVNFYQQLKGSANIVRSDDIVTDAKNGRLPELSMVWHDSPYDEHPVADVTRGQDKIWQAVDAFVTAGLWDSTVFLLSWDDWGGYDDHVVTPNLEHTPDGVQLAYGPRVPLLMFGGPVRTGIDSRWNGHTTIGHTVLDLLGLPPLGVVARAGRCAAGGVRTGLRRGVSGRPGGCGAARTRPGWRRRRRRTG